MNYSYVGIDNGVTGSLGIINHHGYFYREMPVKKEQSYTKNKQNISRIDIVSLKDLFDDLVFSLSSGCWVLLERPMVNPGRFRSSTSALRALEAIVIFLEMNKIAFSYIDSKEWQKLLLPKGLKTEELKKASLDIGNRMFPNCSDVINKHKDADGILIAEYCRIKYAR